MFIDKVLTGMLDGLDDIFNSFRFNIEPDPADARDKQYITIYEDTEIPRRVSYHNLVGPIENQGVFPSCVGQSAEVIKRIHENVQYMDPHKGFPTNYMNFSAYIFYRELCKKNDGIPTLQGTYPRVAMKMLHKYGIPETQYGNYPAVNTNEAKENWKPLEGWEENALKYRIGSYYRCMTIEEMCNAIANCGPLLCGNQIHESFYRCNGIVEMPKADEKSLGGHAWARIGYDLDKQAFLIQNSWGMNWGLSGQAWESFEFANTFTQDCWAASDKKEE